MYSNSDNSLLCVPKPLSQQTVARLQRENKTLRRKILRILARQRTCLRRFTDAAEDNSDDAEAFAGQLLNLLDEWKLGYYFVE